MRRHTDTIGCVEDSGEFAVVKAEAAQHRPHWLVAGALMLSVCIVCALFQCSGCASRSKPVETLKPVKLQLVEFTIDFGNGQVTRYRNWEYEDEKENPAHAVAKSVPAGK